MAWARTPAKVVRGARPAIRARGYLVALRAGHTLQLRPEPTRLREIVEQDVTRHQPTSRRRGPQGGEVRVEVTVEPDAAGDRWAVVRVRDHGIGIPSQDVERIFSQFFRAASQQ